ncbi:MAG: GNAT family N-acetyltransferase [Phototrophicaceae bacterium]
MSQAIVIPPHPITLPTSQRTIIFRKVTAEDLPALEMDGMFIHFRRVYARALVEQQQGMRLLLIAESANAVVGRIFTLFRSSDKRIADGKERAYLYSFFVHPDYRREGLGTLMMQYIENLLQECGISYVTLAVAKDNEGALRLYKRLHYTILRESSGDWDYIDHEGKRQQVHEPCYILGKQLSPTKPKWFTFY